ncbi:MAG: GntR family transcriptional regulator [Sphingobacteriales bacterium 44-15]|nr:MAG: GntR family transcriptional regulator [Sphingobacteriales bacterium 44-15]
MKSSLSKLQPITTLTQVDKIEKTLQEYFRKENFLPGDSIPKEIELAQALGVSRTAIREALSRFKTLGIIESRKNKGMTISKPDVFNNMKRVMDSQLLDSDTLQEIFEMRLVLEMGICDLLFARKDDEKIVMLEEIVDKEENSRNKNDKLKFDVDFHSMLYKISGNNTILRFQKILLPVFDYVYNNLHVPSQIENETFVSHRVLLETLKNGTPETFRSKMKMHLMNYFKIIEDNK